MRCDQIGDAAPVRGKRTHVTERYSKAVDWALDMLNWWKSKRYKPTAECAGVYAIADRIMICSICYTAEGLAFDALPSFSCDGSDTLAIGNAAAGALDASRGDCQFPTDRQAYYRPILSDLGVSSWRALHNKAISVSVRREADVIHLLPDTKLSVPAQQAPDDLGNAILRALDLCTE